MELESAGVSRLADRAAELAAWSNAGPIDRGNDDARLLGAVADGSEEALRTLYDRHGGLVYTIARRMLNDPATAQEVVQDTFLRCWERAGSYDPARGRVHAWLMGIARNRAIDVLRGANHRARDHERPLTPDHQEISDARDNAFGGDVAMRHSIMQALRSLSAAQAEVLELVLFGELTQCEIAEVLGLPLGTVKTRIRDGMMRLRTVLAGEGERSRWND